MSHKDDLIKFACHFPDIRERFPLPKTLPRGRQTPGVGDDSQRAPPGTQARVGSGEGGSPERQEGLAAGSQVSE